MTCPESLNQQARPPNHFSDRNLFLTSCTVYPSWVAGNWGLGTPGLVAAVPMKFWSRLGACLTFCSLVSTWAWRGGSSFGVWGGFSSPLTWLGLIFMAVPCPRGEQV